MKTLNDVRNHLNHSRVKEALPLLRTIIKPHAKVQLDSLTAQYHRNINDQIQGIISHEQRTLNENKLTANINSFITEDNILPEAWTEDNHSSNMNIKIVLAIFILAITLFTSVKHFMEKANCIEKSIKIRILDDDANGEHPIKNAEIQLHKERIAGTGIITTNSQGYCNLQLKTSLCQNGNCTNCPKNDSVLFSVNNIREGFFELNNKSSDTTPFDVITHKKLLF